jgi:hypothetical protein
MENTKTCKNFKALIIAVSLTLPIFYPLLDPRFYWSHEKAYPLLRLAAYHQNVISGKPFCRWFPDFARGFGLPIMEFFPVLPLYIAEVFRLAGFSTINSLKLLIAAMTFFAAWGAFSLGNELWGRSGGFITSILYSYAPYKLVNLYVRGDLNEYMAMAISPWILLVILKSAKSTHMPLFSISSIVAFALPALSHYPSSVIHYPLYTGWILALTPIALKKRTYLIHNFLSLTLGLFITATYWATAFFSRHLVQMEEMTQGFADYKQHFIYFRQWFSFYWNFGASVAGPGDAISFQIGNFAFLAMIPGLIFTYRHIKFHRDKRVVVVSAIAFLLVSTFFTHHLSAGLWSAITILPLIQFPYRILSVPSVMAALLGGSLGYLIDRKIVHYKKTILCIISLVIMGGSFRMCRVAEYLNLSEEDLTPDRIRQIAHTHSTGEYIPQPVGDRYPPPVHVTFTLETIPESGFSREQTEVRLSRMLENASRIETWEGNYLPLGQVMVRPGHYERTEGSLDVIEAEFSRCRSTFTIDASSESVMRVNQFYFDGWQAYLNNRKHSVRPDPMTGLIQTTIPIGTHTLELTYCNLPLSRLLDITGVFTIFTLCLVVIVRKYQDGKQK